MPGSSLSSPDGDDEAVDEGIILCYCNNLTAHLPTPPSIEALFIRADKNKEPRDNHISRARGEKRGKSERMAGAISLVSEILGVDTDHKRVFFIAKRVSYLHSAWSDTHPIFGGQEKISSGKFIKFVYILTIANLDSIQSLKHQLLLGNIN